MKNTNVCPKCKGQKIIRIDGSAKNRETGNKIAIGKFSGLVKVTRYLCQECGFSEEWVVGEELEKVNENVDKVMD